MSNGGLEGSTSTRPHLSIVRPESRDLSLVAELVETTRAFCGDHLDDAVEDLVALARRTTEGCSFASCTTRHPIDGPSTMGATHEEALVLDQLQYGLRAGPTLEAIETNAVVHVTNFAAAPPWNGFSRSASRLAGSVLCVPFADQRRADRAIGSLNLYAAEPEAYSGAAIATAELLATHLGAMLTLATAIQQLATGLASRDAIGQAKGILMARDGLTADEAFSALRRASQRENRKLRDVAAELARSTERPPIDDRR